MNFKSEGKMQKIYYEITKTMNNLPISIYPHKKRPCQILRHARRRRWQAANRRGVQRRVLGLDMLLAVSVPEVRCYGRVGEYAEGCGFWQSA